jgi:hypothetical protein
MEFVRGVDVGRSLSAESDLLSEASSLYCSSLSPGIGANLVFSEENFDSSADSTCADSLRQVICADALKWLEDFDNNTMKGCVFTSLPDLSEMPVLFRHYKDADKIIKYREWFINTVALILRKMSAGSYAIFLQSDIRHIDKHSMVYDWTDKSHLCTTAAERYSEVNSAF